MKLRSLSVAKVIVIVHGLIMLNMILWICMTIFCIHLYVPLGIVLAIFTIVVFLIITSDQYNNLTERIILIFLLLPPVLLMVIFCLFVIVVSSILPNVMHLLRMPANIGTR